MNALFNKKRIINFTLMLSLISGFLNVGMIDRYSNTVTHHTGNISKVAIEFSRGRFESPLIFLILAFVAGSVVCGVIFGTRELFNIRALTTIICVLILIFIFVFLYESEINIYLITFAMGLQNGCVFSFRGVLLRNSHMTGYLTDFGFCLGSFIRSGGRKGGKEAVIFLTHILLFFTGGVLASAFNDTNTSIVIICGYIVVLAYLFFIVRRERK